MRSVLGWMMILLTASPAFAQATSDWSAVTSLPGSSDVRVTGTRGGMRQRITGRFESADHARIVVLANTRQGSVSFNRVNVQRVELVVGDPDERRNSIAKGVVSVYAGSVGVGAGIGALKAIGKGAKYVRVYERP